MCSDFHTSHPHVLTFNMVHQIQSSRTNPRDDSLVLAYSLGSRDVSFTQTQQQSLKDMIGAVSVHATETPIDKHCTIGLHPTDHENRRYLASDWKEDWYRPTFTSLTVIHDPSKSYYTFEREVNINGTERENTRVTSLGPSEVIIVTPNRGNAPGRQVDAFLAETYHLVDGNEHMIAVSRDNFDTKAPIFSAAQWHCVDGADESTIGDWDVKSFRPTGGA